MGESDYIRDELESLGAMSHAEKMVATVFASAAILWVARGSISSWMPALQLTDAGIAIACALALFLIPLDWRAGRFVLHWEDLKEHPDPPPLPEDTPGHRRLRASLPPPRWPGGESHWRSSAIRPTVSPKTAARRSRRASAQSTS